MYVITCIHTYVYVYVTIHDTHTLYKGVEIVN